MNIKAPEQGIRGLLFGFLLIFFFFLNNKKLGSLHLEEKI